MKQECRVTIERLLDGFRLPGILGVIKFGHYCQNIKASSSVEEGSQHEVSYVCVASILV